MDEDKLFVAVRHRKAPQQIIDQVRRAILEGKLHPGDRLPVEQDLTAHFGVSRQTLREALRSLEYLGLLDIRAGANGGAFVSEVNLQKTRDNLANFLHFKNLSIHHISEIRKVLEPYAARTAAQNMPESELDRLAEIIEAHHQALKDQDPATFQEHALNFHRAVAQATHNPILIFIVDFIECLLHDVKSILRPDMAFSMGVMEAHDRIFTALKDRDPDRAAAEMLRDVSQVEEGLVHLAEDFPGIKWS